MGDLILLVAGNDNDRKQVLQKARDAYERYLSLLDHYEILSAGDKKLYQEYIESPSTFSTTSATTDAGARRNTKIVNFKKEKELKKKIEVQYTKQFFLFLAVWVRQTADYKYFSFWHKTQRI